MRKPLTLVGLVVSLVLGLASPVTAAARPAATPSAPGCQPFRLACLLPFIVADASEHNFGAIPPNTQSPAKAFKIQNYGRLPTSGLQVTLTGSAAFTKTSDKCSKARLGAARTCVIEVRFKPTTSGAATATLKVTAFSGGTAMVTLTGSGATAAQLDISPSFQGYPTVATGGSTAKTFTIKNIGGLPTGTISVTKSGTNAAEYTIEPHTCTTLAANATCDVTVTLAPSTAGSKSATITASATPGGTDSASLTGAAADPAKLDVTPAAHNYGPVATGGTATQDFTITNIGGITASGITVTKSGPNASEFTIASNNCSSLGHNGFCTVTVTFNPSSTGAKTASLDVTGSPGGSDSAALSGSGIDPVAALSVTPETRNYGDVTAGGGNSTALFTIKNVGGADSGTIAVALSGPNVGDYSVTHDCTTLAPNATCTAYVKFGPNSAGTKNASLDVSATPGGSVSVALTGVGNTQPIFTLSPGAIAFGNVLNGTSATRLITVTNTGTLSSNALGVSVTGGTPFSFDASLGSCVVGSQLAGLASCTIGIKFSPTTTGAATATLDVDGAAGSATANLSGSGAASPATIVFTPASGSVNGGLDPGETASVIINVSNSGTADAYAGFTPAIVSRAPSSGLATSSISTTGVTTPCNMVTGFLAGGGSCQIRLVVNAGSLIFALDAKVTATGLGGGAVYDFAINP